MTYAQHRVLLGHVDHEVRSIRDIVAVREWLFGIAPTNLHQFKIETERECRVGQSHCRVIHHSKAVK